MLLALAACGGSQAPAPAAAPAALTPTPSPARALEPMLDVPAGWVDHLRDMPETLFAAATADRQLVAIIVKLPAQEVGTTKACATLAALLVSVKKPDRSVFDTSTTGGLPSCTVTMWFPTEIETRVIFGRSDQPFDFGCTGPNADDTVTTCAAVHAAIRFR